MRIFTLNFSRIMAAMFLITGMHGCGEGYSGKYDDQGFFLSKAIRDHLKEKGLYSKDKKSNKYLDISMRHAKQVRFFIYDIKDKDVLAEYIEFIITYGIEITKGVPVSVTVYPKSRNEYKARLFQNRKPIIDIEVNE